MFKNYLTVAIRNLKRHKLYSSINIIGLAVGMACCFLILLFVHYEVNFDHFHQNSDRIFRVTTERNFFGHEVVHSIHSPETLASELQEFFPEIIQTVRLSGFRAADRFLVKYQDKMHYENILGTVDPTFFDVFSFPFLKGDPSTALQNPNSVVITSAIAQKYFGDENPLGKTLNFIGRTRQVTGVLAPVPQQSHIQFQFLIPFKNWNGNEWSQHDSSILTYILLDQKSSLTSLAQKLPDFISHYSSARIAKEKYRETTFKLHLQPVTEIHLYSHLKDELGGNRDLKDLYLFGSLAIVIMILACVNFMNLTTARSLKRAREVGLRKVVGARRVQLVGQFLGESLLLATCAMVLALVLVELALPVWNGFSGLSLSLIDQSSVVLWVGVGATTLLVGFFSGCYPAFYLSGFLPATVVKGASGVESGTGGLYFRKVLVVFQFGVSIVFLVVVAVVYGQLDYMQTKNLGFHKDQVIVMKTHGVSERQVPKIRAELSKHARVIGITGISSAPGHNANMPHVFEIDEHQKLEWHMMLVDYDFLSVLGVKLVAGRNFDPDLNDRKRALIINQVAAKQLGKESPVGKVVHKAPYIPEGKGVVVGVIEDFHIQSLHHAIQPLALLVHPEHVIPSGPFKGERTESTNEIAVHVKAGDVPEMLAFLRQTWKQFSPHFPLDYYFLDERFAALYRSEMRLAQSLATLSVLAVFIACLGLFGLVAFSAERRKKEIGIRKVLGASVGGIVTLLSKDFVKLVLLANVIAWPVAYYLMRDWLANFAYRIDLGWEVFVLSGGLALVIALLTVGYQAWKAARANPVDALRYE